MMKTRGRLLGRAFAGAVGLACAFTMFGGALAQTSSSMTASIISGSCATPGAVAAQLADLGVSALGGSAPAADGLSPASTTVIPVIASVTTVPMKLADIIDGRHAVTASLPSAKTGTFAACGNLGAQATGSDVVVGLAGSSGSRYSGIAWLHDTGNQTQVTVFVAQNQNASVGGGGGGEGNSGENENDG